MADPDPAPATVDIAPPDDESVSEAVAVPVAPPAVRKLRAPAPEPDAPVTPLPPGAFASALRDAGELPDEPVISSGTDPASVRASALSLLQRVADDRNANDSDRIAAAVHAAKLAGVYAEGAPADSKPLNECTYAELCRRLADLDARKAALLAPRAAA